MAPTITSLKQEKKNPNRVNVYLDGEYSFGLAKLVAAWLKVGQELSTEKIDELRDKDEAEVAYQHAIRFLSYRPRSSMEVRRNLQKHQVEDLVIEAVISRLLDNKLVDDENFARLWVENRSAFRPRGRYALRTELQQKGVNADIIEQALENLDESSLAYQLALKQGRQLKSLDWQSFWKKLSSYLSRRGFEYSLVAESVKKVWQDLELDQKGQDDNDEMRIRNGK